MHDPVIRRALISVSDKLGLGGFARGLAEAGIEIYSTGGTARFLHKEGVEVREVSEYTGFPEILGGRVKTLHPQILGGILCRHDRPDDLATIDAHGILPLELVVVNLYPFEATVARAEVTPEEAIEQIDIGGPSLVRAAAKNHAFVTIATSPEQYSPILEQILADGATTRALRQRLAAEAFARTAAYDRAIADYFAGLQDAGHFPQLLHLTLRKKAELRYGENPHQIAAVYRDVTARGASVITARQLNGKELSYNNFLDLDSALAVVRELPRPAAAVIKHTNPCGAAVAATLAEATQRALAGDPQSAFGSILAFNRTVDLATAEVLCQPDLFIEAMVAPSFEAAAVGALTTRPKWKNSVRLMQVGLLNDGASERHYRFLDGGLLAQQADVGLDPEADWQLVTHAEPQAAAWEDLRFAWHLVRYVKSNAIVVAREATLVGAGAGQMSRVDAVEMALAKAGSRARGAVLASDAFFPFADSIHKAAAAGIAAIVQPGGSKRDQEVVAACDAHHLPMVFTGRRHFRH